MALSPDLEAVVSTLEKKAEALSATDEVNGKYYDGLQRLVHMGLATPPELRKFEMVANWCRLTVDSVEQRQRVRSFILPGKAEASADLRAHWDANNLDSESRLLHRDVLIYGRGFVAVGAGSDPKRPLITVESPREVTVSVDPRTRKITQALRLYGGTASDPKPTNATLYQPNSTTWLRRNSDGGWDLDGDPDNHNLGVVPIIMFLNRRRTGSWDGASEMDDVKPLVDGVARTLTNLQVAAETHATPQKYVLGMSKGDFVDKDGKPIPAWESYFSAIWATGNKDAKVGQLPASDLKNFHETIAMYGQLVSSVTGLPMRYLGHETANPPGEGMVRADESRLILNTESKNDSAGDAWGWVMGLAVRIATGAWLDVDSIKCEWHDAGTPTDAQKADSLSKLYAGGNGVISREGVWDELGWSEARKDKEREYLAKESRLALTSLQKDVAAVI